MNRPFLTTSVASMCTATFRGAADVYPRLFRGAINALIVGLAAMSGYGPWSQTIKANKIVVPFLPGAGNDSQARGESLEDRP